MEKNDELRRIVSLLLILTLITGAFVKLPLSVSAEDTGLQGGQSNIINGSFEDPDTYRQAAWAASSTSGYKYVPKNEVPGWNTTSTDSTIELGWMNKNGTSPHMEPTIQTEITAGNGPKDGWQFAETVANETSTIFQSLKVENDKEYNWTVHHRGRDGVDTLALFIVDDADVDYVKPDKNSGTNDHFNKIVTWLRDTKKVSVPGAATSQVELSDPSYTVYTTALQANGAFASSNNDFSFTPDDTHTVKFQVYLMSTAKADWTEYKGTYISDGDKNILFAMTGFKSASKSSTSGNLVDKLEFTDSNGKNLLKNPGFEDFESSDTNGYHMVKSANSSSPTSKIGWSTTASDYTVEIGTLRGGKDAYGLGVTIATVKHNAPYIRDEDVNGDGVVDENDGNTEELGKLGKQFAELNANQESSLYQIVDTDPGKMYKWSLSHRGRSGLDTMALIIGPAQFDEQKNSILPKKEKADPKARDQLMQMVYWLYSQTEMAIDIPKQGCSEKIKLYSPKFASGGGWVSNNTSNTSETSETSNTSEKIFSWQKDTYHTEEWSVWIISSINDKWHDYGEIDENATYNYNYIVPNKQENSIFGFVSHNSTLADGTKNITYGNLLDNIAFKEYYYAKVEVAMNNSHGKAQIIVSENNDFIHDEKEDELLKSGWALIGSDFTVHVTEAEGIDFRTFIGAYINGVFVPSSSWTKDEKTGEYTYTFKEIKSATKVNIIFAAQQIYYDSRSKYKYQHEKVIDQETGKESYRGGPEVQMSSETLKEYTSHEPQKEDGWRFIGWKYISPNANADKKEYTFDAVHTVRLEENSKDPTQPTFSVYDSKDPSNTVSGIPYDEGITFLAEWKYRQRVVAKTFDTKENKYLESTTGGTVNIDVSFGDKEVVKENYYPAGATDKDAVGSELYVSSDETYITVSAHYNTGYAFNGWYDKEGKLVSKNTSYAYKVPNGDTVELYAYFEPHGFNLTIDCDVFGDSGDLTKYFKVNCTFSKLRANQLYIVSDLASDTENIIINGEKVENPTTIRADENGDATASIYMKHEDSGTFVFLPENCEYTIQVDSISRSGFSVRGEVEPEPVKLTETTTENLIFYKASQAVLLKDGKHYNGIAEGYDKITITKNSSYTFQVETRYNPSIYEGLIASLCFYNTNGDEKYFIDKTRILMIDLSDSANPEYYSYTVAEQITAIDLEDFTELGSTDAKFKTGDSLTEKLVFIVDYVGTEDLADSGKVSLVYNDANNELKRILSPEKKAVDIGTDNTGINATAGNGGKAANVGPFAIDLKITESSPAINTTYKEDGNSKYSVKLSTDTDALPDGSYAIVNGDKYFINNGYIKIPSLTAGDYKVNVYSPVPISNSSITFKTNLLEEISASPNVPTEISASATFTCIDVAMDADVVDKVLNPGSVSSVKVKFKHINLDSVGLTVYEKGGSTPLTAAKENNPPADSNINFSFANGFTAESGKTYIFSFVGYVNGAPVLEDKCIVVGGYVLRNN